MGNMSEEKKEVLLPKKILQTNDLLMKPFALGWTREVVMRVITKNRTPNCDIYYFSPNKKRIRSFTELKSILTGELSPECFSFKREPLGLSPDLETVRDASLRKKKFFKLQSALKKPNNNNNLKQTAADDDDDDNKIQKQKTEIKCEVSGTKVEKNENKENQNESNDMIHERKNNVEKESEPRSRRLKVNKNVSTEINNFNDEKKRKKKSAKSAAPIKLSMRQSKIALKKIMSAKQAKQANVVASKKILKKIVRKIVKTPNQKLSKKRITKEAALKGVKNKETKLKNENKTLRNSLTKAKNEIKKEIEGSENDKKSATRDLKSIVKKNIGKYREMREKQKLGAVKSHERNFKKKTENATRYRSEPISKNIPFFLKPLEKGWRRELVYRSNCARTGQRADVYYFHPNGKKLRSCKEIAQNLTHGLSIECFTFRKEPIGCGEPSEVVRNARFIQKNLTN